jgi:hypothetical protein
MQPEQSYRQIISQEVVMSYTLDRFSRECHRILSADPGVEGRKKVCELVRDVLKDEDFVTTHLHDNVPERKILYEGAAGSGIHADAGGCSPSTTRATCIRRAAMVRPG